MGYVQESHNSKVSPLIVTTWNGTQRTFTPYPSQSKSQNGYRSGPLSKVEQEAISYLDQHGTWGQQASMLDALDRIQRATTPGPAVKSSPWLVNNRDYTIVKRTPVRTQLSIDGYKTRGWFQISDVGNGLGSLPNDSSLAAEAASMIRSIRPTRPDFNLTRFIGELRDAPQMAFLANYKPQTISQVGGSYLNLQFGVSPTVSDIQAGAEAVLKADKLTRQFILDSSAFVKRSATRELNSYIHGLAATINSGIQQRKVGDLTIKHDLGYSSYSSGARAYGYVGAKRNLKAFTTFEYFVGDPEGFTSRMDSYVERAKKLLGGGLDTATLWQLTPWTWLSDWFFDIGSLLSYQQSVADYSLVARRSGWVVEDNYYASCDLSSITTGAHPTSIEASAYSTKFVQRRRSGSPYDMKPNWDFSNFQWAILGALGMTRASRIAWLR